MQTIELTVKVRDSKEAVKQKLIEHGFKQVTDEYGSDIYFSNEIEKLNKNNILEILNKSLLVRHHYGEYRPERKFLVFKDKKYKNNEIVKEEIIKTQIEDIDSMKRILEKMEYKELIRKKQHFNDFTNGKITLILEDVEEMGLLIEYENNNDFSDINDDEMLKIKKEMYEEIKSYGINLEEFNQLYNEVGWGAYDNQITKRALENTFYSISVYDNDEIVGYGRIIGDTICFLYIQDIMVKPSYQGQKIGTLVMHKLLDKIMEIKKENSDLRVYLGASKNKEKFYEKFGFVKRIDADLGYGMILTDN